jgi:hypothetical protein
MRVIGIAGRRGDGSSAGAGKDEVAKILVRDFGFVIVSFADEIKRTAMRWYDFTYEQCWGSEKEKPDLRYPREHGPWDDEGRCQCCGRQGKSYLVGDFAGDSGMYIERVWEAVSNTPSCYLTPRFVMRWLGTEAGRMFYADTWTRITLNAATKILRVSGIVGVVIPDVRWPAGNEGRAIRAAGGELWLVERDGTAQQGTAVAKHASETQPVPDDAFDTILKNNGTLDDLARAVAERMKR